MRKKKWMIIFGLSILISIFLIIGARKGEPFFGDQYVNTLVANLFSESTYPFFEGISQLGDKIGIGIVAILMLIWLWGLKKDYSGFAVLFIAVILGNEVNKWLKDMIGRERPLTVETAETLSFPSGHAMVGITLYIITAFLLFRHLNSKKWKWIIGTLTTGLLLLIGLSRIVLQEHFPTDVLGGYSIGLVWTILWLFLYDWLYEKLSIRKSKKIPLNM